jgi:hypothetical protein
LPPVYFQLKNESPRGRVKDGKDQTGFAIKSGKACPDFRGTRYFPVNHNFKKDYKLRILASHVKPEYSIFLIIPPGWVKSF